VDQPGERDRAEQLRASWPFEKLRALIEAAEARLRRHSEQARTTGNPAFFWSAIGAAEIARRHRADALLAYPERAPELPEPPPDPTQSPLFLDYIRTTAGNINLLLAFAEISKMTPDFVANVSRDVYDVNWLLFYASDEFNREVGRAVEAKGGQGEKPKPGFLRKLLPEAFGLMRQGWNGLALVAAFEDRVRDTELYAALRARGHAQERAIEVTSKRARVASERALRRRMAAAKGVGLPGPGGNRPK